MLNRYVQSGLVSTVGVLILCLGGVSHAALVLQPPELNPGDQYRLVFVTSTTRDASSTDIADYNDFVQAAADASPLSALGQTWKAIGSTVSVDARDNTNTNPLTDGMGEPLYVVNGEKIAVDYMDLWDGSILSFLSSTEFGISVGREVWTGTTRTGVASIPVNALGGSFPSFSLTNRSDFAWVTGGTGGRLEEKHLYGLSGVITVVPEPPSLALVDIKPGSFPNSVNLKSQGVLPVAILSTVDFDVHDVDIDTLLFGDPLLINNGGTAVSPLRSAFEDVSGDGLLDLSLKFSMVEMLELGALGPDTIEGLLTGVTLDGTPFAGTDSIRMVPNPEPSTLTLAVLALVGLLAHCRRRRA